VASREILDIYLSRGLEADAVPQAVVRSVVTALDDPQQLAALLGPLDGEAFEALLHRLEDYEGRLDTETPEHLIDALLDHSPVLRTGRRDFYDAGAGMALGRVLLRVLRGRDEADVERAVRAVRSESLWGRYELITTVGHIDGVGLKLVSTSAAKNLEHRLTADVLVSRAKDLARERDLAAVLGLARREAPEQLRGRLDEWLDDPSFVLALLSSSLLESLGGTLGRAGLRRRLQVPWHSLAEMVGEQRLADAVRAAAPVLEQEELDERLQVALEQARRYADDPSAATADLDAWGKPFRDA
jgi:hypothetical protein